MIILLYCYSVNLAYLSLKKDIVDYDCSQQPILDPSIVNCENPALIFHTFFS